MLYDVNSPKEYIDSLDSDWRKETVLELRALILGQEAAVEETIQYKMLCFKIGGSTLFHLNAQRGYVSLYCGNTKKIDPEGQFLKGLSIGKGCIRFSKTKKVANTNIDRFIKQAISLLKDDKDIGC